MKHLIELLKEALDELEKRDYASAEISIAGALRIAQIESKYQSGLKSGAAE